MLPSGPEKDLAGRIAAHLHAKKHATAACEVLDFCKIRSTLNETSGPDDYLPVLQYYLHDLMENGGMAEAAQILWSPTQFSPEPQSVQDVWELFDGSSMGLICGAAKVGKSFSMGVRMFLEWVRDPEFTSIRLLGPSEDHLEKNLFSHMVSLHGSATLPMPGEVGELFIGLNRRDQQSSISGVVIPKGNVKKAGRLQGGHRRPRPKPHQLFGPLARMFLFLDEIENIANGIWSDIDNVISEVEVDNPHGFKIFGAYNPTNSTDEVGKRAEPPWGWPDLDEDKHYKWKSKRGWSVLRLDAERCENVIQNKVIYPGLQTRYGLEQMALNAGGRSSSGYRTMGRGLYPTTGIDATVLPPGMFNKMRADVIWFDEPQPVGAVDLALEGLDDAIYTIGKWGRASGLKYPPSLEHPNGRTEMFKNPQGIVAPRWLLSLESQHKLEKGDSVAMAKTVMETNRKAGVKPEFFACDRTGHGSGVADIIKNDWSTVIYDINYSQGCSETKLMLEDSQTCAEAFGRIDSELWFGLRAWAEFGCLVISPTLDTSKLLQQVTNRRYRQVGKQKKVESKKDYESRGHGSPNEADSFTLMVYAARKGSGVIFSMKGIDVEASDGSGMDDWPNGSDGGAKIDISNQTDTLDEVH